jgi:hypothetical protein
MLRLIETSESSDGASRIVRTRHLLTDCRRVSIHRFLRITVAISSLTGAATLAACESFGPDDVSGFYRLVTINGEGVPNLVVLGPDTVAIFSGWAQMNANLTCRSGVVVLGGGAVTNCTYTLDGQDITLLNDRGQTLAGRTDGMSLLLTDEQENTWLFRN